MKSNGSGRVGSLVLAAAMSIGLGFGTHALAVDHSYLIDLKTRTATDLGSVMANAINDAGQVVGQFDTADGKSHAFITGPNGAGMTDLGTLGGYRSHASGVNNDGQVVGQSETADGHSHAFITGPNGMTDLGTLGGSDSFATGINAAGQVTGTSSTGTGGFHAFITGVNGAGMIDLGTLGLRDSYASGINDSGQVAGFSMERHGFWHAFITGPNGTGMIDLGTSGEWNSSFATGINASGQVAGYSSGAFTTGPGGAGMTDLGTLGGGGSSANGINAAGQVVGQFFTTNDKNNELHAFITGPNGLGIMTDLNSLVHLPGGLVMDRAIAINDMGQVIATVAPEPESYALMLAGLALMGVMVQRKQKG
jgi:probable HAF family extracellular repeat protein